MKMFANAKELAQEMSKEPISGELERLLSTRKAESIEYQLADENDSVRKSFYLVLVDYFNKEFLKKRIEITELTKKMAKMQSEELDAEQAIDRISRESKLIKNKIEFLEDINKLITEFDNKHRDIVKNPYELMRELTQELVNKFESQRIDKKNLIDSKKGEISKYKGNSILCIIYDLLIHKLNCRFDFDRSKLRLNIFSNLISIFRFSNSQNKIIHS